MCVCVSFHMRTLNHYHLSPEERLTSIPCWLRSQHSDGHTHLYIHTFSLSHIHVHLRTPIHTLSPSHTHRHTPLSLRTLLHLHEHSQRSTHWSLPRSLPLFLSSLSILCHRYTAGQSISIIIIMAVILVDIIVTAVSCLSSSLIHLTTT